MQPTSSFPAAHRQAGLSLIEVLVTVVLVGVGLLGIAGLQLTSVQNTNSAAQRFQATLLAEDIVERMRANRGQVREGRYEVGLGSAVGSVGLARDDLLAWRESLAELAAGDGGIEFDGNEVTVTITWTDSSTANPDDTTDMVLRVRTEL